MMDICEEIQKKDNENDCLENYDKLNITIPYNDDILVTFDWDKMGFNKYSNYNNVYDFKKWYYEEVNKLYKYLTELKIYSFITKF